jgi:DNA-binding NtrC family response regulator
MPTSIKRILIVAHDGTIRETRSMLLESVGYRVSSVASDDGAMAMLNVDVFDLVLIGRNSLLPEKRLDHRLRERYPSMLILKIDTIFSAYPTRMTDSFPASVLMALRDMLS